MQLKNVKPWILISLVVLLTLYWLVLLYQPPNTGDEAVYVLASQELMQGKRPEQLNTGHPPVGTYLIALSLLVFGNPRIVGGLLASVTFAIMSYFFVKTKSKVAVGVPILMAVNPLFIRVMSLAALEVFWVSFAVLGFLAISRARPRWISIGALLLGLAVGSKWSAIPFVLAALVYLIITSRERMRYLPVLLFLTASVYAGAYAVTIGNIGWNGFLENQLSILGSHQRGEGAVMVYSPMFKGLVVPLMTFLGFTNALYVAPYIPHLFLFDTYWYLSYLINPALWIMTIPSLVISVHRLTKEREALDLIWLLFFGAGLSVIYLTPKFFIFYFDGLSVALAYLVAAAIPGRIRVPYYVLAALLPMLLYLSPIRPS